MPEDGSGKTKAERGMQSAETGPIDAKQTSGTAVEGRTGASHIEPPAADEFGLPVRPPRRRQQYEDPEPDEDTSGTIHAQEGGTVKKEGTESTAGEAHTASEVKGSQTTPSPPESPKSSRQQRQRQQSVSEWSHQQLAPKASPAVDESEEDEQWQEMPALATHRIYDDWGKVIAKEYGEVDDQHVAYGTLGGAGKGYTRVQVDDDAQSATSMDESTAYLFKDQGFGSNTLVDEDEDARDLVSQMQATKDLLTEGQRIAYVGVVRLSIGKMLVAAQAQEKTKGTKKAVEFSTEACKMWGQKMMVRLYGHMEIDSREQVMVEQLTEHGVLPSDLTPALMQNARVKNPQAQSETELHSPSSTRPSMSSPRPSETSEKSSSQTLSSPITPTVPHFASSSGTSTPPAAPPPAYEDHTADQLTVEDPASLEKKKDLDLDIRWTVLCDLFLLLIADSTYDARSRTLLEHVGASLSVDWQEICRFEKRVTDALEMQEQADKENWNEEDHLESRKKASLKKRLMVMGLCTVGGGLVIGLSAGLLAPVIGAGLAAGFTTIGVAGTSTFLGGTGAAALIGTTGAVTGSFIGVKASNRRTGAVKTFEYRPLFNNKRVNLIVTVSGWMTGKVDDVRLPFSTIDPVMGDIYSVNWEPEMLQSTGQTIQILATEALTQTIQQILGSTILTALMAGLSVPIVLTKLSYLIDNPWTVSLARADSTGLILADSLIDRNLGVRPITLVGFSLGSRVIFSCLKELAKRGAIGLVQNVYLFGSPVIAKKDEYIRARTVVAGRFVNGYATNDWILGYLFRATSGGIMRVSGLSAIEVEGVENYNVTKIVPGHMAYRVRMPLLLQEVGWLVEGTEFSEIEDPDPENHDKRQRELINEIEAARRELEVKNGEKKRQGGLRGLFGRKKVVAKKDWETYDERSQKVLEGEDGAAEEVAAEALAGKDGVMFDVDAIRREAMALAVQGVDPDEIKQHIQIREIESTLPALKVSTASSSTPSNSGNMSTTSHGSSAASSPKRTDSEPAATNGHLTPVGKSSSDGSSRDARALVNHLSIDSTSARGGSQVGESTSLSFESGIRPSTEPRDGLERPPLRTVSTTPASSSKKSWAQSSETIDKPGANPWMREEDLGGEEGEISMSFE